MAEILYGLADAQRGRVETLRGGGDFFWLDVSLSETSLADVAEALDVPEGASHALETYAEADAPTRNFYADGQRLAFSTSCYIERSDGRVTQRMRPLEAPVLVSDEYLLTLHKERVALTEALDPDIADGRSEQYFVYAVLDAMVGTGFAALNELELTLDDLMVSATDLSARVRMATLQGMISGLSRMRRRAGPQRGLFDRIGMEIERLPGLQADEERYFDRLATETNRLLDAIDATGDSMASLIDLRLNEMSYWLTVVATIFLPLTFITGFFGMNFDWMIGEIDTQLAFWLLGVGTTLAGALIAWRTVVRRSPIMDDREREGVPGGL